jgi:hypothetical protein
VPWSTHTASKTWKSLRWQSLLPLLSLLLALLSTVPRRALAVEPVSQSPIPNKKYIFQHIGKAAGNEVETRLIANGVMGMFEKCHPEACLNAHRLAYTDGMITSVRWAGQACRRTTRPEGRREGGEERRRRRDDGGGGGVGVEKEADMLASQ